MFVQDIESGLMPVFVRSGHGTYNVDVMGSEKEQERAIALIASIARYDRYDLREVVSDAFRSIANVLAWEGVAAYEIVLGADEDSNILLSGLTSKRLFHIGGHYIQWVPREDVELWGKAILIVPDRDVWTASMPASLGGSRGHRRLLRAIDKYSHLGPEFWRSDLEKGKQSLTYDFRAYNRGFDVLLTRLTRVWGWTRRDTTLNNWTEYMLCHRLLTFRWAQAVLREDIASQLNSLLARVGIQARIVVSGLPTANEILETRDKMRAGETPFEAALKSTSIM